MFFQKKKQDIGSKIKSLFKLGIDTETFYEELEEILLEGDLGPRMTMDILDELRELGWKNKLNSEEDLKQALVELVSSILRPLQINPDDQGLWCFLILGVNGVGKTTSIAKLAHWYRAKGITDKIVLAAGDTFRAAATEQLITHGQRLGFRVVSQGAGADPGAVLFDALESARAKGDHLVIADTAGRLHNKANLVRELQKIHKIVANRVEPHRYKKLLVLDATTGQNGLQQAQVFHEALGIDGIILTKYDSTARGGLAVSVARALDIPFLFLATGEGMGDLTPFDPREFAQELISRIL